PLRPLPPESPLPPERPRPPLRPRPPERPRPPLSPRPPLRPLPSVIVGWAGASRLLARMAFLAAAMLLINDFFSTAINPPNVAWQSGFLTPTARPCVSANGLPNHPAICDAPPAAWIQAVSPGGLHKFAQ